jgi:site-specific DNA recombinase
LVPNNKEAATVCRIFSLYLELGCVSKLSLVLDRLKIRSKIWTSKDGARHGGVRFQRGALYSLLRNRTYIGEIRHRDQSYPGEHEGIVPRELWNKVQAQLQQNHKDRQHCLCERSSSLLTGLLYDGEGNRFSPSFTVKNRRRYRYYVLKPVTASPGKRNTRSLRLPAHEIESRVSEKLQSFLKSDSDIFEHLRTAQDTPAVSRGMVASARKLAMGWKALRSAELSGILERIVRRIVIHENSVEVLLSKPHLRQVLEDGETRAPEAGKHDTALTEAGLVHLTIQAQLARCGGEVHLIVPPNVTGDSTSPHLKSQLVKAVARAYCWYQKVLAGGITDQRSLAKQVGLTERYVGKVFRCAFLAPDIVEAILEGRQPRFLTFKKLCAEIPVGWVEQRRKLGFL